MDRKLDKRTERLLNLHRQRELFRQTYVESRNRMYLVKMNEIDREIRKLENQPMNRLSVLLVLLVLLPLVYPPIVYFLRLI